MSYINYDFPNTCNYNSDLGFLIKQYKELIEEFKKLIDCYENIRKEIEKILNEYLHDGKLLVKLDYEEETKTLYMVFDKVGE